mmetsp:Transcript_42703/g.117866  ORF Transcript_42703/g.117866 Transcript_42703/m.117866 type:complete len:207 (-) Transcript_42703:91-711(-)
MSARASSNSPKGRCKSWKRPSSFSSFRPQATAVGSTSKAKSRPLPLSRARIERECPPRPKVQSTYIPSYNPSSRLMLCARSRSTADSSCTGTWPMVRACRFRLSLSFRKPSTISMRGSSSASNHVSSSKNLPKSESAPPASLSARTQGLRPARVRMRGAESHAPEAAWCDDDGNAEKGDNLSAARGRWLLKHRPSKPTTNQMVVAM